MPSNYNENSLLNVKDLVEGLGPVKDYVDAIDTKYTGSFRSLFVSGNTVNFYTSTDHSGVAAATLNFPEEYFLQQTGTDIVEDFEWSNVTYPDSTDPDLDGKTVFVMAIRGSVDSESVKYTFVDMARVMKAISNGDASITVSGMSISVRISSTSGNLLTLANDGIYVGSDSTKADKVANATANNFAKLDASGNIADSGVSVASTVEVVAAVHSVFSISPNLTLSTNTITIAQGASDTVTVTREGSGAVSITNSADLPEGLTASVSGTTVTITVGAAVTADDYTITVGVADSGLYKAETKNLTLTVSA